MPVEEEGQLRVDLLQQGRQIEVVVMHSIVHHAVAPSHAVATQIDKMDVEAVECVLDCTL